MSESLMVLTTENVWTRKFPVYRQRSHFHWILQVLGAGFSITGAIVLFISRSNKGKGHIKTIHSILGLISLIIMCCLCLSGATLFYTVKLKKLFRPVVFKFIHEFLGIACFTIGIAAECWGFNKNWFKKAANEDIASLAIILTIISAIITIARPVKSLTRNLSSILRIN